MSNKQTKLQTTIHIINLLSLGLMLYVIGFIAYQLTIYEFGDMRIIFIFFLGIFNILPQILIWRATQRATHPTDHLNLLIIKILVVANNIFWYHDILMSGDTKFVELILMIAPLPAMLVTVAAYLYIRYSSSK